MDRKTIENERSHIYGLLRWSESLVKWVSCQDAARDPEHADDNGWYDRDYPDDTALNVGRMV